MCVSPVMACHVRRVWFNPRCTFLSVVFVYGLRIVIVFCHKSTMRKPESVLPCLTAKNPPVLINSRRHCVNIFVKGLFSAGNFSHTFCQGRVLSPPVNFSKNVSLNQGNIYQSTITIKFTHHFCHHALPLTFRRYPHENFAIKSPC